MKKIKIILIGFAALISLLILLPFLIPVETYLRQAETMVAEKLHIPVTIGKGHMAFLPTPRLVLNEVTLGKAQEVTLAQLEVVPTLNSLFADTKILTVQVDEPVVKKAALDLLPQLMTKEESANTTTAVNVQSIQLRSLQLVWPEMKLPVLDVDVALQADNRLRAAQVVSQAGDFQLKLTDEGDKQKLDIQLKRWTSPVGLPVLIDQGTVQGYLYEDKLALTQIDAQLYQGKLNGNLVLAWPKQWKLNGKVNVAHLAVEQPSRMVSKTVYVQGKLDGQGGFSATAKSAGALADHLQANFNFNINQGVLQGLDLIKIASLLVKQNEKGGATEFDEFSGLLTMSGKQYHLKNLKVSSGLLAAQGQVKVKPDQQLDGEVEVELKRSVSLAAIPLEVGGTVNNPTVFPSKSAMAGAVAGTAILGPGVGTSLGIKAGNAVSKIKGLFGGDQE